MKRKGFDLEATHNLSEKLDKLFAIVSLAFLICFAWGCRIRFYKQYSSQQSQRKSLFRSGLEDILRMMQQRYSEHSKTRQDLRCQIEAFEEWISRCICGNFPRNVYLDIKKPDWNVANRNEYEGLLKFSCIMGMPGFSGFAMCRRKLKKYS